MQKLTKRILKIVGKISDEVINKYKLYNYKDKNIVQSLDLYIHTLKHKKEFISSFSYENTLHKIPEIILSPNYVYYDSTKNSLLYFKKLEEYVCVVVKLNFKKNKDCYIATIYPINKKR